MEETYFAKLKKRIMLAITLLNNQAEEGDVERNHVNYGEALAFVQILRDMGHETDLPISVREDNGCLKVPYIMIDGNKTEFPKGK